MKKNQIFHKIFLSNTHEQIQTRAVDLLKYLLRRDIVGEPEIEDLWNSTPLSDQRGRGIIEKLIADVSKDLPIQLV